MIYIIPYRSNGRLVFHLCRSCAEAENNGDCNHKDKKRSFIGTYVIDEVVLALNKGYKVIDCFELYEYLLTQYNPETASGWARDNMTEVEKLQYITDYFEHEKVQLLLDPNIEVSCVEPASEKVYCVNCKYHDDVPTPLLLSAP
ncbi:hypothetical protein B566_EDAN014206 [Ephemera danica]|nr:hypothetical protein B566_EDAN014206 [Ephemera danica]